MGLVSLSSPKCGKKLDTTAYRPVLQADQRSCSRFTAQSRGHARQSARVATARRARSASTSRPNCLYAGYVEESANLSRTACLG
jgi:hypothetical protein